MLLQRRVEVEESFRQTIGGREAEIALRLLEPSGEVGARLRQFFVETARDRIEPLGQLREGIICGKRAQLARLRSAIPAIDRTLRTTNAATTISDSIKATSTPSAIDSNLR